MIEKIKDGIFRIKIPFETIYTSSFVLVEKNDAIVYDFGSNDFDAERYVIPELEALGVNVKYIAVSHAHGDHCGGIGAMMRKYPSAELLYMGNRWNNIPIKDGDIVLDRFRLIHLRGHSDDGMAVLDTVTNSLISGDALQAWGVDRWKTFFTDKTLYLEMLEKVKELRVDAIIASHEYEPCGFFADGKENAALFVEECIKAAYAHRS